MRNSWPNLSWEILFFRFLRSSITRPFTRRLANLTNIGLGIWTCVSPGGLCWFPIWWSVSGCASASWLGGATGERSDKAGWDVRPTRCVTSRSSSVTGGVSPPLSKEVSPSYSMLGLTLILGIISWNVLSKWFDKCYCYGVERIHLPQSHIVHAWSVLNFDRFIKL